VQAWQPPPSLLIGPVQGGGEKVSKFGLGPVGSPHLPQLGFQVIGEVQQVAHIIERIPKLGRRQGPRRQSVRVSLLESAMRKTWAARLTSESG